MHIRVIIGLLFCQCFFGGIKLSLNDEVRAPPRMPIIDIFSWTGGNVDHVPISFVTIFNKLSEPGFCRPQMFTPPSDFKDYSTEFLNFVRTRTLPNFQSYKAYSDFLFLILRQMPKRLLSAKIMKNFDKISLKHLNKFGGFTPNNLDALGEVFKEKFQGRGILFGVLIGLADYVEKKCTPWGYVDLAHNVSSYLASQYTNCGWLYQCNLVSRDLTLGNMLKIGAENLRLIYEAGDRGITVSQYIALSKSKKPKDVYVIIEPSKASTEKKPLPVVTVTPPPSIPRLVNAPPKYYMSPSATTPPPIQRQLNERPRDYMAQKTNYNGLPRFLAWI